MTGIPGVKRSPSLAVASLRLAGPILLMASAAGASPQSDIVQRELNQAAVHAALPAWNTRARRRDRFLDLARRWRHDTRWLSSTTEISLHPAYQEIIGMGPDALPFILEELRDSSDHWFWALKAISSEDPVPPSARGSVKHMTSAWLRWGRAKNLIPA